MLRSAGLRHQLVAALCFSATSGTALPASGLLLRFPFLFDFVVRREVILDILRYELENARKPTIEWPAVFPVLWRKRHQPSPKGAFPPCPTNPSQLSPLFAARLLHQDHDGSFWVMSSIPTQGTCCREWISEFVQFSNNPSRRQRERFRARFANNADTFHCRRHHRASF